ncbi:MAG TPA: CapA family protein [Gemmatimonadales bacterium]|nr:CapA family protein [Gemmatimonadales bacterium]
MSSPDSSRGREECRIALGGDVMLGRLVDEAIGRQGASYPWGNLLPLLHGVDLFLVNLECVVTDKTERWRGDPGKPFFFRADPRAIETLRAGRVDFVSLANNHAGDYGMDGLCDMLQRLDQAGIAHAGAGADLAAASAPAWLEAGGLRIAVLAFADHPAAWAAGPGERGIHYLDPEDPAGAEAMARQVEEAGRTADLVIVSAHWGPNMCERPSGAFRAFARSLVEAGADVFWGHSAHVVQGIEWLGDRVVLFDTGDLVDDYAVNQRLRNDLSALFILRVARHEVRRLELVPVRIEHMQAGRAGPQEARVFLQRLTPLCLELGTTLVSGPHAVAVAVPAAGSRGLR